MRLGNITLLTFLIDICQHVGRFHPLYFKPTAEKQVLTIRREVRAILIGRRIHPPAEIHGWTSFAGYQFGTIQVSLADGVFSFSGGEDQVIFFGRNTRIMLRTASVDGRSQVYRRARSLR